MRAARVDQSSLSIVLPWMPKDLSPNGRIHWARLARAKKLYRRECWLQARTAGATEFGAGVPGDRKLDVHLEFVPPDKRHRDADNLIASMKAGLDGLADALGIDDRMFRVSYEVAGCIGGFVSVTVKEA